MDKDVLTGVDEFDEFTEMPEFNRTANASTVLRKLLSNNGLNNLKQKLRKPDIPKAPIHKKSGIEDAANHIKNILIKCQIMRTRSKKYDTPDLINQTELG